MKKESVLLVLALALPSMASAQLNTGRDPSYRDPGTATIYSVILPGGGQLYSGETGRGLMLLGASSAAILAGTALSSEATCSVDNSSYYGLSCKKANHLPLTVGMLASLGVWGYGIFDARKSAERQNVKRARNSSRVAPSIDVGATRTSVGVSVGF